LHNLHHLFQNGCVVLPSCPTQIFATRLGG
jgi:hypothetical protein